MQHSPRTGGLSGGTRPLPSLVMANVCSGGVHTTYAIAGRGPSVLVLGDHPTSVAGEWQRLLSGRMRVLVPDVPTTPAPSGQWLAGFLDGLGRSALPVIAVGRLSTPALELARNDSGRFDRLVLVGPSDVGNLSDVAVPILILDHWSDASDAARIPTVLLEFLLEPTDP